MTMAISSLKRMTSEFATDGASQLKAEMLVLRVSVEVSRWWLENVRGRCAAGRKPARHDDNVFPAKTRGLVDRAPEHGTEWLADKVLKLYSDSLQRVLNGGDARPQSTETFANFVKDDWMPVILPTLKYATQKHYCYMLDVHLVPAFGKSQLRNLTREDLQGFLSRNLSSGLSRETVHHFKCGLSKILGAVEKWGCVSENLAQKTKLPRRQYGTERIVLTPVEVQKLTDALREPVRSFTLLLVLTGLRVGELLALRLGSVDVNARLLRVVETVYDGHFDKPKTKRGTRTIPLGAAMAELLTARRPAEPNVRTLVFAKGDGSPLDRWNLLRKHLKPVAKKLGLFGVTWHLLRHSHATMLDGVGTPIGTMQSLLGHSAPDITREIYLHAIPEDQRRAVENVERLTWAQSDPSSICDAKVSETIH
jgi:integrase